VAKDNVVAAVVVIRQPVMRVVTTTNDRETLDALTERAEYRPEFESVLRCHYEQVYALAYRLCGDRADAEDVAQEVFVKAARGWLRFRGEAQPWSWLYRITVHVAADGHKARRRARNAVRTRQHTRRENASVAPADGYGFDDRVQAALSSLPFRQRVAIVLTACEGMSHREVAELLGCAEVTVSWHVHRSRKKLRQLLTRDCDDD
jgi:RNA polymerase sigma-70 factor (ECF subfamily)